MDPGQKPPLPPDAGISVVVPVRDFAGLPRFRDAWETQLARLGRPIEFHVVVEQSLGAALRAGIELATQPLVLLIVPDFAYRPGDVRAILEAINEADMALGVRLGQTRTTFQSAASRIGRWISRVVFGIDTGEPKAWYGFPAWRTHWRRRIRFGMRVQDPVCGLRLVRRELLERCPIQSDGSFALVEMIAKINFAGGLLVEVPLGKPSDLPTMLPYPAVSTDERNVFRNPTFAAVADKKQDVVPEEPSVSDIFATPK